jgi:hypothetical protein
MGSCSGDLMLQASLLDGLSFDPFSFQEDGFATSEVDVGGVGFSRLS